MPYFFGLPLPNLNQTTARKLARKVASDLAPFPLRGDGGVGNKSDEGKKVKTVDLNQTTAHYVRC